MENALPLPRTYGPDNLQESEVIDVPYAESWKTKKQPKQGTILVVDDDEDQVQLFAHLLRGRHYRVLTAQSAAEGWKVLANNKVDCIVCDVFMPRISGQIFARRVRTLDRYKDVPIIMITAAKEDIEMETLASGADLFCPKKEAVKLLVPQVELLMT